MKKIKGYLHLYLNANVKCRCFSLADREGWIAHLDVDLIIDFFDADSEICAVMPILRKLEDMSEEEAIELFKLKFSGKTGTKWISIQMKKEEARLFHETLKIEPSWRVSVKYLLDNGKESGMSGSLSLNNFNSDQFIWLLSKGFDLFGLIDAGLAVNAKDLKV